MQDIDGIASDIADFEEAIKAFLHGDRESAVRKLGEGCNALHKFGSAAFALSEAMLTLDSKALARAQHKCREALRASLSNTSTVSASYAPLSPVLARFHALTRAEALLLSCISKSVDISWTGLATMFVDAWKAYWILHGLTAPNRSSQNWEYRTSFDRGHTIHTDVDPGSAHWTEAIFDTAVDRVDKFDSQENVERYVDSGVEVLWGLLQLVLSILPASYQRIKSLTRLFIDRGEGFRTLRRARCRGSINGSAATLCLVMIVQSLDGICNAKSDHIPKTTETLLSELQKSFPKSDLWAIFEARVMATRKDPANALSFLGCSLASKCLEIRVMALCEEGLMGALMHDYQKCREVFMECALRCPGGAFLFYYMAASATLEQYRRETSTGQADQLASSVDELFGKSNQRARQHSIFRMPFPFAYHCSERVSLWDRARKAAKRRSRIIRFVDVIATSPFEEMIGHWNAHKNMDAESLLESWKSLTKYGQLDRNLYTRQESLEEGLASMVLQAKVLLAQEKYGQAENVLQNVLRHRQDEMADRWPVATAAYLYATAVTSRTDVTSEQLEQARLHLRQARADKSCDLNPVISIQVELAEVAVEELLNDKGC